MEEWDSLPYWQTAMYMQGLEDQGILKSDGPPVSSNPGQALTVDYASDGPLPPGFKTRRAG